MQMRFEIQQFSKDTKFTISENISWLILQGVGELCTGSSCYKVSVRDFLRLPIGMPCFFRPETPVTAGVICLFDMVSTRKECSLISAANTELIGEIFWLALKAERIDNPHKPKIMNALWQLMWEAIMAAGIKHRPINTFVQEVLQQINDHYLDSSFDLNGIIAATGYSLGHFRKMFKEETGTPPLEHLNLQRLEHAKKIMWSEAEKAVIKNVAERSGFADANNFTKFFKRTMGITPKQYIEQILKEKK